MLIRTPKPWDVKPSEITDEAVYRDRRRFIKRAALVGSGAALAPSILGAKPMNQLQPLTGVADGPFSTDEEKNTWEEITTYNNFYEYGTGKDDPASKAPGLLKTEPWTVEVTGEAGKTGPVAFEDLLAPHTLEERTYRLRCVEAWSMVIPWVGIPLADVLKRFRPTSKAKYVVFETLKDPEQMPGQRVSGLSFLATIDWPYREGLRLDEAMNPLAFLAVGLYGKEMPAQNGAPIRLVVPWKYGFKSGKSIVRIHFQETRPATTWNDLAPSEYGFYANVNPHVDHPRWSQATEKRIGAGMLGFGRNMDTQMFNGYGEQVAHLYKGMDLQKHF